MKWLIYKHTSPTGKVYIGQTMQENPQKRWQSGNGYKSHNTIFYKAIQKYGWDNFSHEIIESNIQTQREANEKEIYWISFYDAFKNGYNATLGGNNVGDNIATKPVVQIEINNPQVIYRQYKSASEASRKTNICSRNIGACCLKQGQITAGGFYWCFYEDFKNFKPLIKRQGKTNLRKIYCFETDSVFDSIIEASIRLNISKDGILSCCKNKQITAGNCHFCYYEDFGTYKFKDRKNTIIENPLYQIDKSNLNILHEFINISQASQFTQISHQSIGKCLNKKAISAGGFYWCKKQEWFEKWAPQKSRHTNSKEIYCIETNQKFETLADAAKITGINISSISECCNKKLNTAGTLHWCFYAEFASNKYILPENKNLRKIVCIETKGTFNSLNEAAKKYKLHSSNISECLKNPSHTTGGLHWCYLENYNDSYVVPKQRSSVMRNVVNIENCEIFDSIREAAKKYNICEQNIYRVCKGKAKTAGGYHWEYVEK